MKTIPSSDVDRSERFPLGATVRLADLDVDPYPILARLRSEEPVTWVPEVGMWFVTRRDAIVAILRDAARFTTDAERSTIRDIFGAHMMTTDGDVALRYKRACLHAFRADTVAREMGPWIEAKAEDLVEGAIAAAGPPVAFELMTQVATPLAVSSALRVLGLPPGLAGAVAGWFDAFALALANFSGDPEVRARGKAAAEEFADTVRPMLRDTPGGDRGLLGHLAGHASPRLADDEIIANALIILFGGIETTASMIGNTVWSVLVSGGWPAYVEDPATGAALMEEALRWQPAVQSITRHTTEDVRVLDVPIPAGSVVQCMIGGANRDDTCFDEPDAFRPGRPNAPDHLSFGTGRHLCLGAHLARLEISAVLDALRRRVPGLSFAGEAPSLRGYEFRRPPTLWLRAGP